MTEVVFALGEDADWLNDASCRGGDNELFFSSSAPDIAEAKAICARCPVRIPCLVEALENNEQFGIWGGTDPVERRRILRSSA